MLGKKRAVALMLAAFLLLSALPVSTMASDKAATPGSSEAACFDRLLETAPIDEAASDTGADQEEETVQEYEKGAGEATGALFGCEMGAEDETDATYGSVTGAGDETGALLGCDSGGETGRINEDRAGLAEIPGEDNVSESPASGEAAGGEYDLSEETESEAEDENTADKEDSFADLTGEAAGTAFDSGEMSGDGMPDDQIIEDQQGAEDVDTDRTDAEGINDPALYGDENISEDAPAAETDPDQNGETDAADQGVSTPAPASGEESPEQTAPENTDDETVYDSPEMSDENFESEAAAGDAAGGSISAEEAAAGGSTYSEEAAADSNTFSEDAAADSSTYSEEAAADSITFSEDDAADTSTYSEEAAAGSSTGSDEAAGAPEAGNPAGSVQEGGQELLSDQTPTDPDSEAGAVSVDERAALTAMSLSLTDQIVMNIFVRADNSVESDDYMEFSCAGESLRQSVGEADVNRMTLADGEAFDVLAFALPLRMRQMTDDVTFRMVVDGVEGTPKTRTVRSYADQILQGHFSDEQKEVTRAMLNCGSCAQEYFGYNTDRPANAGIYEPGEDPVRDWEDPDLSSFDYSLYQESLLGFEFCETTLELREDISLICYFRVGEGHFFDNFTNWFYDFSLKGSGLDLTPGYDRDKGMYYVRIPHIMPYELDEMFEIEVTGRISGFKRTIASLRYSPLTYCRDMLASDSSSPEIKNLCRSLYYYCNAANIMKNETSPSEVR